MSDILTRITNSGMTNARTVANHPVISTFLIAIGLLSIVKLILQAINRLVKARIGVRSVFWPDIVLVLIVRMGTSRPLDMALDKVLGRVCSDFCHVMQRIHEYLSP